MKRLGVVITDGVGYRNFVLSDFVSKANINFEKVIIFSCLPISAYEDLDLKCEIIELPVFEENFFTWFFRKTKEVAHLQLHKIGNFGITDNLKANFSKQKSPRGFATRFIYLFTSLLHSEWWINKYENFQYLTFSNHQITKKYASILKEKNIQTLFFTHQRPPYIAPLIYASKKLKIKTSAFIFSWDNLASKGRMAGSFDHYLVWSDLMKQELLQFYTSLSSNQIDIVGTPQFEPYILNKYGYSKEKFIEKFNLEISKKNILFSCGDVSTSPNDPLYIETIARAILNDEIKNAQLLVRTSPAETPERFASLANKYPFVKWNYPQWKQARSNHQEAWSQRIPTVNDVSDLKSVLQYCDICVNMLSTMSLDAMLFDKPIINTVFGNLSNKLANDQRFLKYKHIENLIDCKGVEIALNSQDLINLINENLESPKKLSNERKQTVMFEIGIELNKTTSLIANVLSY